MEQIRHGIDEDDSRSTPAKRKINLIGVEGYSKSGTARDRVSISLVARVPHCLQALG
jgi:hypothetical protein